VLLAYAVGGLLVLAGALALSELAAMMPRSGGMYNFLGAAFGRVWAFLFGWMETFVDSAGSSAAVAIVFGIFLNDLIGGTLSVWQTQLVAVGIIVVIVGVNLASVHANGILATVVTTLKVAVVVGIGVAAFVLGDGSWGYFGASGADGTCEGVAASSRLGATGFGAAVVGALWSYNGWTIATFVAEEVRSPERTLPKALVGASVLLVVVYLIANAGYFFVMSPTDVASVPESSSVAGEVLVRIMGASGAAMMTLGMMISCIGALHSTILSGSRLPFAMARDGLLPGFMAWVSRGARIPAVGVVIVGSTAIVFAVSGTFDLITDLIVFAVLIFNGLAVGAVYVLRRRMPDVPRPYRVPGYPWVPALFLLATLYLMVNTLVATPGRAMAGLAIIAAGLPVYWWYARRLPPARMETWFEPESREEA
jgi:APA family basic amino acid/polyamine antiporter